jgi:hypothetical protein
MKQTQVFQAKIQDGKLKFYDPVGIRIWFEILEGTKKEGQDVEISIGKKVNRRTDQQNKALHKFFELVSDEMNEQGIGISTIMDSLKEGVDIFPTPEFIKEVWRLFQKALLKKESTTQLTTDEIDKIYELFTKWLGEKFGIYIQFPSETNPVYQ